MLTMNTKIRYQRNFSKFFEIYRIQNLGSENLNILVPVPVPSSTKHAPSSQLVRHFDRSSNIAISFEVDYYGKVVRQQNSSSCVSFLDDQTSGTEQPLNLKPPRTRRTIGSVSSQSAPFSCPTTSCW